MQNLDAQCRLNRAALVNAIRQMFGATQIGCDRIDINDDQIAMPDDVVQHEIEFFGGDTADALAGTSISCLAAVFNPHVRRFAATSLHR